MIAESSMNSARQEGAYILPANRLYDDGHLWCRYQVAVPSAINTMEQLLRPELWLKCATRLKPLDVLEVVTDDGAVTFELRVTHVNPGGGVNLAPVMRLPLGGTGAPNPSATNTTGAGVFWRGPHNRYTVERGEKTLRDGFETADAAWAWLHSYNKQQEAA